MDEQAAYSVLPLRTSLAPTILHVKSSCPCTDLAGIRFIRHHMDTLRHILGQDLYACGSAQHRVIDLCSATELISFRAAALFGSAP